MGDPRGFLSYERRGPARRPVALRLADWREVYEPFDDAELRRQAARCMDCGIPFCHEGCPLGNLIPEWNELVMKGRLDEASARLLATNNFPELTGRLCPAPCEGSCVLGIAAEPVLIKQVELEIANHAARSGKLEPSAARRRSGRAVAVVGSGPAGLAAAQQLTRAGHDVVVFERAEDIGGLLRYGIPSFKLEKEVLDRRLDQMRAEGTQFVTGVSVGTPGAEATDTAGARLVSARDLLERHDALVLALGSTRPRDLAVPGRQLSGVHFAMEYLKVSNIACEKDTASPLSAKGRSVVIIGGGDTGADCLGTVHRQRAASVRQLEIMATPPDKRASDNPWPTWPLVLRSSAAHEEGGERHFAVETTELLDDGRGRVAGLAVRSVRPTTLDGRASFEPVAGSEDVIGADLVLLALGFLGPEQAGAISELGLELDERGNIVVDAGFETSRRRVFACGDAVRGQSLIVWAIAEGRSLAAHVDAFLSGSTSQRPPIRPGQLALA